MYAVDILDQKDTEFSNILLYNVGQPMWTAMKLMINAKLKKPKSLMTKRSSQVQ